MLLQAAGYGSHSNTTVAEANTRMQILCAVLVRNSMKVHAVRASAKSKNTTETVTCTHSANLQTDVVHIFGAKPRFPADKRRNVIIVLIKMTQNEKGAIARQI